ncbi:MAG TPA: hypothetical protein VF763_06250 [Candidatus Limnocylindrales bacterium]
MSQSLAAERPVSTGAPAAGSITPESGPPVEALTCRVDLDVHYRDASARLRRDRVRVTVGATSREAAVALATSLAAAATAECRALPLTRLDVQLASICCRPEGAD